jgi:DNA-binding transcriptional ArsR family regulator
LACGERILKRVLNDVADLDRAFHALADPGRRLMLARLGQGPAAVSELGRPLPMSLAAVVQHGQILEASGLVRAQKLGRTRTCSTTADGTVLTWTEQGAYLDGFDGAEAPQLRREGTAGMLDGLGKYLA